MITRLFRRLVAKIVKQIGDLTDIDLRLPFPRCLKQNPDFGSRRSTATRLRFTARPALSPLPHPPEQPPNSVPPSEIDTYASNKDNSDNTFHLESRWGKVIVRIGAGSLSTGRRSTSPTVDVRSHRRTIGH